MVADAALDPEPQRSELAWLLAIPVAPAAGKAVAGSSLDAVARRRVRHRLLESAHEWTEQDASFREPDDGVRHQLTRPVVGDFAAAFHADELDAARAQRFVGGANERGIGVPSERQDRIVLQEQ